MAAGAAIGLLAALLGLGGIIGAQVIYVRLFLVVLCVLAGVVLGRLAAAVWATKKMRSLNDLLYRRCEPTVFLEKFIPIAKKVPVQAAEHVDAQTKIAFAYEALGEMDLGLEALAAISLGDLKLHVLQCTALQTNQSMRLYLLKEDTEAAAEKLKELRELQQTAAVRAPTLGKQLSECVRLGENWLHILLDEDCDLDYIREEIRLSQNSIHKSEMQLLLGYALRNAGADFDAKDSFLDAVATAPELYAGRRARMELDAY